MICELASDALYGRANDVCSMLDPLLERKGPRIACRYVGGGGDVTLIAFSGPEPVTDSSELWRFRTHVPALRGAYHERWRPVNEKRKRYYLDRAYLHLYTRTYVQGQITEKELLLLHCDPNEPGVTTDSNELSHWKYKRGPHLHISVAEQPIPHSHFALNACHLNSILSSVASLSEALEVAIKMLEDQVLQLYK